MHGLNEDIYLFIALVGNVQCRVSDQSCDKLCVTKQLRTVSIYGLSNLKISAKHINTSRSETVIELLAKTLHHNFVNHPN